MTDFEYGATTVPLGYKCIDVDFHFYDYARGLFDRLNPQAIPEAVKSAGGDSIMLYGKDHWGNVYHRTKISHEHPSMEGDLLGAELESARQSGLKTTVFFSVCWDEHAAADNPNWTARDPDGVVKRWYGSWTFMCINSPYRDYVFAHLQELVTNYDFDSIFIDPFNYRLGVNAPCYCQYCQKLWNAQYGGQIPHPLRDEDKARYMDFRDQFFGNFLRELKRIIRASGKNTAMTHIFGTVMDYDDYLNVEGDPFGQDYYTNSIKTKIFRDYADGRQLQVLTERFSRYWDFTMKSRNQLRWELATILAHNATFMLVDHADIHGELHAEAYEAIADVFKDITPLEREVRGGKPFAEIALLYSERDEELILDPLTDALSAERHLATVYRGHVPDFVGAFKLLTEEHLPFDVVVAPHLTEERLSQYQVLIVPNTIHLSPERVRVVRNFVERGGKLIFTQYSATRDENTHLLAEDLRLFGLIESEQETPYTTNFVRPAFPIADTRYLRLNNGAVYIRPRGEVKVLGRHVQSAIERTDRRWVTHNDIPGEDTDSPAIVVGQHGDGAYVYCAFRFFKESLEQDLQGFREAFRHVLHELYQPSIWVDAPRCVEANYLQTDQGIKIVLTNCTVGRPAGRYDIVTSTPEPLTYPANIQELVPIADVTVKATGDLTGVSALIEATSLRIDQGANAVTVPRLGTFEVLTLPWSSAKVGQRREASYVTTR